MNELKVTGSRIHKGGQQVGTSPQRMRLEWIEGGESMVAIEMYVPGNVSQHKAKTDAVACIDLLLETLRHAPRAALQEPDQ